MTALNESDTNMTSASANPRRSGNLGNLVLSVKDLNVQFPSGDGTVHAVRGVSYDLHRGETLGIVGESGSGKSVTSLAIMGLLPKSAKVTGSVQFEGTELVGMKDGPMSKLRGKRIAMVFQDPMTSLDPVYKVGYQITETLRRHDSKLSKAGAVDRAVQLLELVGIPNPKDRVNAYPHEFSGGMRQRVVIAIAMANEPDVIIADEPTTALDVTVQAQILEVLRTAQQETGAATVLITHDLGVVAGFADRVLVMYAGRPVEMGTAEDIYYTPRMPYAVGLLGSLPRLDSKERVRLVPIPGNPPSMVNAPPGCPFSPRCPMRIDICDQIEPPLEPTDKPLHLAACHRSAEVAEFNLKAADVFDVNATADATLGSESGIAAGQDGSILTGEELLNNQPTIEPKPSDAHDTIGPNQEGVR